jgi:ATP-dependent RNA helicase RhlE
MPTERNKLQMKFHELGLSETTLRAVEALGYETATPIQCQAIPIALSGRDLVGCAQTGTGKTAAFTLPTLDRLMRSRPERDSAEASAPADRHGRKQGPKPRALRALVLSPTRELAVQIDESFGRYGRFTPLRHTVVYGGVSQFHQVKALRHGVDTLVATPGRLLDLMEQGYIDLSKVEILVLDEADQMLDMGFLPALKRIISAVPVKRQTLMFSATMPDAIRKLADQWLDKPVAIQSAPIATPAERVKQTVHLVDRKRKAELLTWFLKEKPRSRTLVFSRTKHGADKIVKHLKSAGVRAAAIHGNKSQNARSRTLEEFKSKNPPVLVATDIAARGLDINNVSHIVNFDLPDVPETYIHRIGRTARAGASGAAVSFCAGDERNLLKQIERLMNQAIEVEPTLAGFEATDPITTPAPVRRSSSNSRFGQTQGARPASRGGSQRRSGSSSATATSGQAKPRRRQGARPGKGGPPAGKTPRRVAE